MHAKNASLAVRLVGFARSEANQIECALVQSPATGPSYFCLLDDSLQEPDLLIVNGDKLPALAALAAAAPDATRPALIVGEAAVDFGFPSLARPLDPARMQDLLADLVRKRAAALDQAAHCRAPVVPERRRRPRLDLDLLDPALHEQRRQPRPSGAVLIVDQGGAFRDHVARLIGSRNLPVEWTDSAPAALRLCEETPVSLVMINTATPAIDPYHLCSRIKAQDGAARIAVVFLVSPAFHYNSEKAHAAGVRGLLDKPVADRHLVAALGKLLSLSR